MNHNQYEQNDLSNYFKLISLLHKERPLRFKEQVEEIVKREQDNAKRIELINEIDKQLKKDIANSKKVEVDVIHKDKSIQPGKKKIKSAGFFSFLFFNRKMIVNFAERTETLVLSFFGLKKVLSSMAEVMWEELYENTKKFLIAPVSRMVQKGWLSLDITSYNLVASFDKFLKNFIRIGADLSISNTPTANIRIIEGFLRNYLKIVFIKEYREILEESISEFVLTDKRFKSNYKQVRRLVKEFIDVESRSLCFFNIINAVYIIHYNRFIKLPELCKYYGVEDINHKKYNFSPKIESDVKDYIKKIEHKYNLAESELFFLKYIEEIDFNSKPENPVVDAINNVFLYEYIKSDRDIDDLKELLEKEEADDRLKNTNLNPFAYLKLDVPRYILKFITGYRIIYRNILTEPISVEITDNNGDEREDKVNIFQHEPFIDHFNKIAEATRELSILTQNEKLTVTSKSYLHYIERRLLESKDAEMSCKHIETIISNLYFISSKLSNVLYRNFKASTLQANDLLQAYKNQHEPINVKTEEYNLIPYSFNIINNNRYHENKKIIDVLNEIMYITVNFAYLFKYENLMDRLIKKPELINDSEYYVKIKSKIFN